MCQAYQHVYLGALYGLLALNLALVDDFASLKVLEGGCWAP